ncbi:hypothetical protein RRG08_065463 [Elysia crispata]|uniref:Uncharacterized protein n=1 Tax=Elysia crispata TaxID=231223 RepID=A0AAE0YDU1_9GAST|nr:hypothetical protein RRG08_065463 [Elysia crispata]
MHKTSKIIIRNLKLFLCLIFSLSLYRRWENAREKDVIWNASEVDGMERFVPVVLSSLGVSTSQSGRYTELLVADCGLEVAFDGVYRVVVRVATTTHGGN